MMKTKTLLHQVLPVFVVAVATVSISSPGLVNAKDAAPSKPAAHAQKAVTPAKKTTVTPVATATPTSTGGANLVKTDPLQLLQDPNQYINKKVVFEGTFNRFSDIALDYKKAFRDSRDYVTFFILRPDAGEKTIPLSELKLFFPRKKSDDVLDLEPGDKIAVEGSVFSTALNEPWIDVEQIKILKKTDKPERKHKDAEF